MLRGEYGQARSFLQKNINDLEEVGIRRVYLWGRARLGYVALREGSIAEAHQILVDTTENFAVRTLVKRPPYGRSFVCKIVVSLMGRYSNLCESN